ncbi:hypothetical protein Cni_G13068 [Canna indica]|uniref:Uncharacterized protein n=1 Tax=Canna indica TaxID=4628 RepID=A0AAQ3K9L6_9LILI|nr:hypothetical protein Cni_G13068 [Canna indica]
MDPPAVTEGGGRGRRAFRICSTCCFSLIFYFAFSILSSLLVELAGSAIERFSASTAVSIPSTCRILSSSVDLRSSKVCEHGILTHNAKIEEHLKKPPFRCHYDYYWAAIFEVEYQEYFSGQIFHAVAEAPKEALPHDCRPEFGAAWLTTMRFKVNETYKCGYLLGSQKVDIYSDDIFECPTKAPSTPDATRGYLILLKRLISDMVRSGPNMVYLITGAVCGMLVSMLTVILAKCLHILARAMAGKWKAWRLTSIDVVRQLRRACHLFAYFSVTAWLMIQYGKLIGLKQLLFDNHHISERTT